MFPVRAAVRYRPLVRTYAAAAGPHSLVFLEHYQGTIDSGSLSALTAAQELGGEITGLIIGGPEHVSTAVEKAKRYYSKNTFRMPLNS